MRILGVDPGLRNTGFGVIDIIDNCPHYILSGVIETRSSDNMAHRLRTIMDGLLDIINKTEPNIASIEKIFVNSNPASTLLLGQARGVAIVSCIKSNIEVVEYTALQVKQAVVGYGHAEKAQVAKMITYLLKLNRAPKADAADALAVALTHAQNQQMAKIFNKQILKSGRLVR